MTADGRRPAAPDGRRRRRGRAVLATVATVVVLALVAAACSGSPGSKASSKTKTTTTPTVPASDARLHITPGNGSRDARPDEGIAVTVSDGTLTSVRVRDGGDPVVGQWNPSRTVWHSTWALNTSTSYTVTATAVDPTGRPAIMTSSFRTLTPAQTFTTMIFEGLNATYGVGMPILLTFSRPILNKAAVERSLEIWTSRPVVGAWYWDGNQALDFRPETYWPPYTTVRFVGHLNGVEGAPGVWGFHTLTQTFSIGKSLIAVDSTTAHVAKIYLNDHLFAVWPISTGRAALPTPDGSYLSIDLENPADMVGPGYNIEVPYSVRFTWTGDYMHDAWWSVGVQGYANVSHGCVNMSPADAQTYFHLSVPGDPITIVGSPLAGSWDNGWTEWFLTWQQYLRGSALHKAVLAGPKGSFFVNPASLPPVHASSPLYAPAPGNADANTA